MEVVTFASGHTGLGPHFKSLDTLSHLICVLLCLFVWLYFPIKYSPNGKHQWNLEEV